MPSFTRAAGVLPGGSWRLPVLVVTRTDASAAVPTAGDDPQLDQDDPELTPTELTGFVAELFDARAEIEFLKGRVSTLTSLLDKPATVVAAASVSSNVDMEYVRSLQRQFARHKLEADQNRLSPRRTRK